MTTCPWCGRKPSRVSRLRRWLLTPSDRTLMIGCATEALYREMGHQ